jgi:hypothetical protein
VRLTDKPYFTPFRCAAIPYVGQTHENTRWIDTGEELDREHIYLSEHAIREACKLLGWASPEEHVALQHHAAELAGRVAELEDQLTEAERFADAIDVIESKQFRARKKTGRPKKETQAA